MSLRAGTVVGTLVMSVLGGCSDVAEPTLGRVEIQVVPAIDTLMVHDTTRAVLSGFDQDGRSYPAGPVSWQSSNPAVVGIDTAGLVEARGAGTAFIVAAVGALADSLQVVVAGTRHTRAITASEVWSLEGAPHLVSGVVNAGGPGGVTVTIEPGALVLFDSAAGLSFGVTGTGSLMARGDAAAPIVMRGVRPTAAAASWRGLTFRGRVQSELRHVTLSGCGGPRNDEQPLACVVAGHRFLGSDPTVLIDHLTIDDAAGAGIVLQGGSRFAPGSAHLSVRDVRGHVATVPVTTAGDFPLGGAFSGNDVDEIVLIGGTIRQSVTWQGPGPRWFLEEPVIIEGPDAPVLTVTPGVTMRFASYGGFVVGKGAPGGVRIGAAGAAPVTLTTTHQNSWAGIAFGPYATPSSVAETVFENCGSFSTAGYGQGCVLLVGNFFGTGPAPVLENVTIRGAVGVGVGAVGGGRFGDGSRGLVITETVGSPGTPISFYRSSVGSVPPGSYTGNTLDAIWIRDVAITRSERWRNHGVPYMLIDGLLVGHWVNPILTLDPGVVLRFAPGAYASIGQHAPGGLRAIGLDGAPVVFSGQLDFPGAWMGIVIGPQADASTLLERVTVDFAGGDDGQAAAGIRVARDLGSIIRSSLISRSAGCGIARMGTDPWVTDFTTPALGNTFQDNAGPNQCGP